MGNVARVFVSVYELDLRRWNTALFCVAPSVRCFLVQFIVRLMSAALDRAWCASWGKQLAHAFFFLIH